MTDNAKLIRLLREILGRYEPSLAIRARVGKELDFSHEERLRACDHLTDELCEFGLAANDEPNEYGKQVEQLIDMINKD